MGFDFVLPLPPALNRCYRSATTSKGAPYTYKTKAAKQWQADAFYLIKQQAPGLKVITDKVAVTLTICPKYDRDIDSSHKLLLDTLEQARVIENDKQIHELHTYKVRDKSDTVKVNVISLGAAETKAAPTTKGHG